MEHILGQVLAGTQLDKQGEKLSKEFLARFCQYTDGKKIPLYQHHDMSNETVGYFNNIRLVECVDALGEWNLIADVYAEKGFLDEAIGGFSISGFELIHSPDSPDCLLYLPFPEYNEDELLNYFIALENIQLNKWIKKAADPVSAALLVAAATIVITPVWDDVYKRKIAPKIDSFMANSWPKLKKKKLNLEHIQVVDYKGSEIQVRLIGEKGKESICYSSVVIEGALKVAIESIKMENKEHDPIHKIVLVYHSDVTAYVIFRVEYSSGEVNHFA
jgi:hypothetical protein